MFRARVYAFAILVGTLVRSAAGATDPPAAAELILTNGKVWAQPEATAVAIWRDRIIAVGDDDAITRHKGQNTKTIDLKGRRVLPGFFDAHAHVLGSGMRLQQVALKDAKDETEFGKRLTEFDRKTPRDRWMLGGEWDHDRTFGGQLPTAAMLDKYVLNRPVFIRRYDGHMALANTPALQIAGITAQTKDPDGGVIYRDPKTKQPTGLLRDTAMDLVDKHIPPPTEADIVEGVAAALAEARQVGVTSIEDMDGSDTQTRQRLFRLYQRLAREGKLTARINLRWPIAAWKELAQLAVEADFGNDFVRIGGVKGFIDGSLGSSTAKFYEPYLNEPGSTGVYVTPREQLQTLVLEADKAGISVCVHAIGDRGNAELLDIYAEVIKRNGPRDRRFRVEHAQHLRPQDCNRFRDLGVIASVQPYHAIDDGRWAVGRIGPKRCASSYAIRSLLDAKAVVAFGSDWSVAPLNPFEGIEAAVHRRTLDGKHPGGWFPEQKISVREGVEAYTLTSAYAACQEKDRGSITSGKIADMVVLDRDILAPANADQIAQTKVLITIVGGRIVHETGSKP